MHVEADREYLKCEYCGTMHFPDANAEGVRVLEEPSDRSCPVCAIPLIHAAVGGQRILYCTKCHGMLIPMDNFMEILLDLRSHRQATAGVVNPPDWKDLNRRINCPQCGNPMDTHPYGGGGNVILDDCERCSLNWLDYGELDRIVQVPDPFVSGTPAYSEPRP
jgi:Zn-finger nucleic acid-binding protein